MSPSKTVRKTLVVVASTLPVGGAERVLESLALGLPAHGIDLDLLCLREPGAFGERILAQTGRRLRANVAPARFAPLQVGNVARALRELAPDAVLVLDHSNALLYGGLGARRAGITATFTPIHSTRKPNGAPSLGRVDRTTVRLSRLVIALSPRHADYVERELGVPRTRLREIPNGVDAAQFGPGIEPAQDLPPSEPGRLRLGILAALRPEKNHRFLLSTLAAMAAETRPHLYVIGDGALRVPLEREATARGLDATVSWLGVRHDVSAVLRALDAVVLPSQDVVETFPVSVLEAMASELPVVVSDVGAVRDMLDDGVEGIVVPPDDARFLDEALARLSDDRALRARMGAAGRARVLRDFTLERMVRGYANVVDELTERA